MALKDITQSCQKYLQPYADHIIISAQLALQSGSLKLAECSRIMYSIGRVLSVLPLQRIMDYLNLILMPSFKEMQELLSCEPVFIIIFFIIKENILNCFLVSSC